MTKEITVSFPERQSLGSLYTAEQSFPHQRKWVGEARGTVSLKFPEDRMLGVALGSLGWEGLATTNPEQLAQLKSLDVSTCQFNERSLNGSADFSTLVELRLDYLKVGDAEMRLLHRFGGLKTIWLTGTEVTDGGLREFKEFTQINNLVLKSTPITDQGIANLGAIPSLQGLNLPAQITDTGLQFLKQFSSLKRLDISFSKVTNDGLRHLKDLPALSELYLSDTAIGDEGLVHLSVLPSLKSLILSGTKVSDAGLAHLEQCKGLEHLDLRDTKATEIGVARLRSRLETCAVFGP